MKLNYIKVFVPLLAVLVGLFLWSSKNSADKGEEKTTALADRYALTPEQVTSIDYTAPEGGQALLVRDGDGWQMSQPGHFRADPELVNGFLAGLLALQPDRILSDLGADKIAEYGLDAPKGTIILTGESGQVLLNLAIGSATTSGSNYYAQAQSDGAVLLLPLVALEEQVLSKGPNDFRSRAIFAINPETVRRIVVSYPSRGGTGYTMEKQGEGWMVTAPFVYRARERKIDALFVHLHDLLVENFMPEQATSPAVNPEYGLGTPQAVLTLTSEDGSTQQISLGANKTLEGVYATASGIPEVFLTQQHITDKLIWTDDEVKEDRLVVFGAAAIGTIEVRLRGADNLLLELGPDGAWHRQKPTSGAIDQHDAQALIGKLLELAPAEYLNPTEAEKVDENDLGFSEYTLKIELKKVDTFKTQTLTVGKFLRGHGFYTRDSSTAGVYILPRAQIEQLQELIDLVKGGETPSDEDADAEPAAEESADSEAVEPASDQPIRRR